MGTLVLVLDEQSNGCSEGHAMLQARLELDEVLFRSLIEREFNTGDRFFAVNDWKGTGVVRLDWPGLLRVNWT